MKFLSSPVLTSVSNATGGMLVKWGSVKGATKYYVYRKDATGTASWSRLGIVSSTSYTDTTASSGKRYCYTVVAYNGTYRSTYDREGKSAMYVAQPKLTATKVYDGFVMVTWQAVAGAERYNIYRKIDGGSWVRLAITEDSSYVDTNVGSGVSYTYTVRASASNFLSDYDRQGLTIVYLSTPVLDSAVSTDAGVQIDWKWVNGAMQYSVYRKTADSAWIRIADTEMESYLDTAAVSGETYSYTVIARCKGNASYFDRAGLTVTKE
jgi:fibronectin type 3 domain-containing protein